MSPCSTINSRYGMTPLLSGAGRCCLALRCALPGKLLLQLARPVDGVAGSEVLELEQLAKLDLSFPSFAMGSGNALGPFDRLFPRLHLDQPVSGDQLLRLGEGPVDHRALSSGELDARPLRARLEPRAIEQHPRF